VRGTPKEGEETLRKKRRGVKGRENQQPLPAREKKKGVPAARAGGVVVGDSARAGKRGTAGKGAPRGVIRTGRIGKGRGDMRSAARHGCRDATETRPLPCRKGRTGRGNQKGGTTSAAGGRLRLRLLLIGRQCAAGGRPGTPESPARKAPKGQEPAYGANDWEVPLIHLPKEGAKKVVEGAKRCATMRKETDTGVTEALHRGERKRLSAN